MAGTFAPGADIFACMSSGTVTFASTSDVLADLDVEQVRLSAAEHTRAKAFRRDADRADFLAAHVLVRACAAYTSGRSLDRVEIAQQCALCGGPHGRPVLLDSAWRVSMAHTHGYVAAACAPGAVGVDIEASRVHDGSAVAATLTAAEQRVVAASGNPQVDFLRFWVRKETLVKAGQTTLDELATVDTAALPNDARPGRPTRGTLHGLRFVEWVAERADGTVIGCAAAEVDLLLVPYQQLHTDQL